MDDRPAITVDRSSEGFRPVPVLRVGGELCLVNAPLVEVETAKILPEALLGLVLDLSDLRLGDELGLLILPMIARRAEREYGLRVALAGASTAVRARLRQLGARFLGIFDTVEQARASLEYDPTPRSFAVSLPFDASASCQARDIVEYACDRWGQDEVSRAGQIIVSELVANAIEHACPTLELVVRLRDRVQIEVADGSPDQPVPADRGRQASCRRSDGYGLIMVDAFSANWGFLPTVQGKIVWAMLPRAGTLSRSW
ncbi:STAS domain-containing protein [Pseudonocardia sp. NPDC049154]|uniref:STAS domain-containing protein n=1 Tax=Pseudonocardia sp. NPDC049154 TaxID=3155501 RepID=UPI0033FB5CD7